MRSTAVKLNCNDENASQEMTGAALLAEHVDLEQVLEQVRSAFTSQELMNNYSGLMLRVKPQTLNPDPKSLVQGQRHWVGGLLSHNSAAPARVSISSCSIPRLSGPYRDTWAAVAARSASTHSWCSSPKRASQLQQQQQ